MEFLKENIPIIRDTARNIKRFCPDAVVITVTNPVDPLNYAMYRYLGLGRQRLIGYSLNDSIRFRMVVARALGVKSAQVEGMVIGEHGDSQVLLFSSIRVDGQPISVSGELKKGIWEEILDIQRLWNSLSKGRTSAWTSAVGLASVVHAISRDTREVIPCSVLLDGEYKCTELSIGVPAVLGRGGVQQILEYRLPPDEQVQLNRSINAIKAAVQLVDEIIGNV